MRDKKAWIKPIVILVILSLAVTYAIPWVATGRVGTSSSLITLAFDGIGRGMDPKGNSFSISEIKSETVLAAALKDAGMSEKLSTDEFRRLITIKPIVGREALNKLIYMTAVNGKTEDVTEKSSYPSQFLISIKDIGLPSYISTQKLEESLTKAYFSYLKSKYLVEGFSEPTYTENELFKMDYPEIMTDLYQQSDALVRYAEGFTKSTPKFVSKKTGISFADLSAQASFIRDTDVRNTAAVASYYILTKDIENRLKYEEVRLKRANILLAKAQGREIATSNIMSVYDNSDNYMFASGEMSGVGIEPTENTYYNELMKTFVASKNNTIEASYNVAEIEKNINKLAAPNLNAQEYKTRVKQTVEAAKSSYAQINQVKKQIKALATENYEANVASKMGATKSNYDINTWGNFILNFILLAVILALAKLGYTWVQKNRNNAIQLIKAGVEKIGK